MRQSYWRSTTSHSALDCSLLCIVLPALQIVTEHRKSWELWVNIDDDFQHWGRLHCEYIILAIECWRWSSSLSRSLPSVLLLCDINWKAETFPDIIGRIMLFSIASWQQLFYRFWDYRHFLQSSDNWSFVCGDAAWCGPNLQEKVIEPCCSLYSCKLIPYTVMIPKTDLPMNSYTPSGRISCGTWSVSLRQLNTIASPHYPKISQKLAHFAWSLYCTVS